MLTYDLPQGKATQKAGKFFVKLLMGNWTGAKHRGATRLLQILISEAAHLIWVLRCERVIQVKIHNRDEIRLRWHKAINRRLTKDKINATIVTRAPHHTILRVRPYNVRVPTGSIFGYPYRIQVLEMVDSTVWY